MELTLLQIIIMGVTVAFVIGGGIYAAKSVKSADGFALGGRSAGVPLLAGSIGGTCVGGGASMGTSQLATTIGLSAWWFTIGTGLALIVMGIFYARKLRETGLTTIAEYQVKNYGAGAGYFTSTVSSGATLLSVVASTLPGIEIMAAILLISPYYAAAMLLVFVVAYSFFGGMKSAGMGGILKMGVMLVSLFLAGWMAMNSLYGNPALANSLPDSYYTLFGISESTIGSNLLSLWAGIICTQSYVQIVFSASSPKTAAWGCIIGGLIAIPVGWPCAMIGMYMQAAHPEVSPMLAMPTYLLHYMPPYIGAVAMGSMILAVVSSVAGLTLGIGTMLSRDIFEPLLKINTVKGKLWLNRMLVVLVIILSMAIAIANKGTQTLFWNYLSMALRGGGIFLPLTLAIFKPRAVSPGWAVTSMIVSTLGTILAAVAGVSIQPMFVALILSGLLLFIGWLAGKKF